MTDFEFLSVLVSIVIGFGLTHLLGGLGHAYYFRHVSKMDSVHVAWTITVFFVFVLNWWVFLLWRSYEHWTFTTFIMVIVWTTVMYSMALALYPPRLAEDVDYRTLFESNRTWLLAAFAFFCLLDMAVTAVREQAVPETFFLIFVGHYAVIAGAGIVVRNRRYDLFLAWYILISLAMWSIGVRGTLFAS